MGNWEEHNKSKPSASHQKTYRGSKTLSHALDIITRPVFLKRGFAENRIITDWVNIVGKATACRSVPRKLTFARDKKSNGTLYVEVHNSSFATEMVYLEPMILEKIACYFGYKAVSRLKILQNPQHLAVPQDIPIPKKNIPTEKLSALELSLAGIDDEDLKASLRSLGQMVLAE
jgi:hypothetical protein